MFDDFFYRPDGSPVPGVQQPGQFPQGQPGQLPMDETLAPYSPGQHFFGQFAPNMRPPFYVPRRPFRRPGPIRFCVNRFAYIWLENGREFWAWISFVARRTVYGYRWNGRRWVYFQVNANEIDTFICIR